MVLRASFSGVICTLVLVLGAGIAGAVDGVTLASDSSYEIAPDDGVMHVETGDCPIVCVNGRGLMGPRLMAATR